MRTAFTTCLLLGLWAYVNAQDAYRDSLEKVLPTITSAEEKKETLFVLGKYLVQRAPEDAEAYADQIAQLPNTPKDSTEWGRLNDIYAASHRWQGNYTSSLEYYQKNYDYYKRQGDQENMARSGYKIGTMNMYLGNNVLSQKHLMEVAEMYNEFGTARQKARISNSLASFYLSIEQYEKGKDKYLDALKQFEVMNDSSGMASCNANLGYVYTELGEYEKAEKHLLQQKALNVIYPTLREMGFHHDFMGLLRQEQGKLEEAYKEHSQALKIRENLSSTYNLCESKLNMGSVLIQMQRYQEAIGHLKDVLSFEEHQSLTQQNAAHEQLSQAYEALNQAELALGHYKSHKEISDSIYNEESIQIIADKDARYKKKEQDAEIALLNKQNEVNAAQLKTSRTVLGFSITGLVLFSILSFYIYRLYKRIKGQNGIIKQALDDKNLLIQEIHHRVKNNLQVISSLLSLQSHYIQDENAIKAIQDGRSRVQSMALLHQNLYREDDITGVNIKTYFGNLVQEIFNSYNIAEDDIRLDMEIDAITLDIDTVIPLGLITNELITNALKYAFEKGHSNAKIHVGLRDMVNEYHLLVQDNGKGIEDNILTNDSDESFGQQMITAFVEKLNAEMTIDNKEGTTVLIKIPKKR